MSESQQRRGLALRTAFTVVAVGFLSSSLAHAQGPDVLPKDSMAGAAEWLKSIGSLGITIWYLWYDISRVKPRMEKAHREEVESMRKAHREEVESERKDFLLQLEKQEERHTAHWTRLNQDSRSDAHDMQQWHREDSAKFVTAIDRLSEAIEKQFIGGIRNAG